MPADHEVRTSSGPELLDALHAVLEALWQEQPEVGAADQMAFATALAEIAANIVEHASEGALVPVRLLVRGSAGSLVAVLEDEGVPYEPPATVAAGDDPWAETGRGLTMARLLADELAYERAGRVNRWRVVRQCRG